MEKTAMNTMGDTARETAERILVVDDDRESVRLLRAYLEQAGFQVLSAGDGETALHILRRDHPDLAVLDLMLPNRDGWSVIKVVREDFALARIPIIILTGRVGDNDRILGLELSADDYVTKPFNPREVVLRARSILRRSRGGPLPATAQRCTCIASCRSAVCCWTWTGTRCCWDTTRWTSLSRNSGCCRPSWSGPTTSSPATS